MDVKNGALQQQLHSQSSRAAQARTLTEMSRDAGEKTASAVGGSHLSFSKILALESEKQRRQQHFKQEQNTETKKTQPLLTG